MTVFDDVKLKDIDEFVEWLNEHGAYDGSSWIKWFDDNYCKKCEPEFGYLEELNKECECAWCELNGKCKYFQELDDVPDDKQIIKMWLERDVQCLQ